MSLRFNLGNPKYLWETNVSNLAGVPENRLPEKLLLITVNLDYWLILLYQAD